MANRNKTIIIGVSGSALLGVVVLIISLLAGCGLNQVNCPTCGVPGPTECVARHILENRPDILAAFAAKGWDTSRSNWKAIAAEWSKLDPAAYLAEYNLSAPQCAPATPPRDPEPYGMTFSMDKLRYLANAYSGNGINGNDCERVDCANNTIYQAFWKGAWIPAESCPFSKCWFDYCHDAQRWNPLRAIDHDIVDGENIQYVFEMPCTTWVSTIWYLAGVKEMDIDVNANNPAPVFDGWTWYITINNASNPWQNGDHLYKYIAAYHPELLENPGAPALCLPAGFQVKDEDEDLAPGFIDGTEAIVDANLEPGDILQFYGSLNGNPPTWKHTVLVVEAQKTYTIPAAPWTYSFPPQIASFGTPHLYGFSWKNIQYWYEQHKVPGTGSFDYTHVRLIKFPDGQRTPLLPRNLVKNASFESLTADSWEVKQRTAGQTAWGDASLASNIYLNSFYANYGEHYFCKQNPSQEVKVYQLVSMYAGSNYKLRVHIRCDSEPTSGYVYVDGDESGLPVVFQENFSGLYTGSWGVIEIDNISFIESGVREIGVFSQAGSTLYVDDIQLIKK